MSSHSVVPPGGVAPLRPSVRADLVASLVVFLIALPLCLAIGLGSGSTPAAGLISGVIGGLVVGVLAGSPLQVSGPAAGLMVIMFHFYEAHRGDPGLVAMAILLAGLIQIAAGLASMGQWFRAVSPAVIHGMLAGIGAVIFAGQFHRLFDREVKGTGLRQFAAIPETLMSFAASLGFGPPRGESSATASAGAIGLLAVLSLILWKRLAPPSLRGIPASLVAVILASVAAAVTLSPQASQTLAFISVPTNLVEAISWPAPHWLSYLARSEVWLAAVVISFIASAETLLCATAVDGLHNGPRTRYDRELFAQGVGNSLCGALGGLPMTGVIVRSAANVEAGATTRWAAVLHGVWLLALVVAVPGLLSLIPVCALAAVLVLTGWRLMDVSAVRHLWAVSPSESLIYLATFGTIVASDLLTGVLTGLGLSLVKLLWYLGRLEATLEAAGPANSVMTLRLRGSATFLRLPVLAGALDSVPPGCELRISIDELNFVDHACLELLETWQVRHRGSGGSVVLDAATLNARFRQVPVAAPATASPPAITPNPAVAPTLIAGPIPSNGGSAGTPQAS